MTDMKTKDHKDMTEEEQKAHAKEALVPKTEPTK
jgi:hypothetical protein